MVLAASAFPARHFLGRGHFCCRCESTHVRGIPVTPSSSGGKRTKLFAYFFGGIACSAESRATLLAIAPKETWTCRGQVRGATPGAPFSLLLGFRAWNRVSSCRVKLGCLVAWPSRFLVVVGVAPLLPHVCHSLTRLTRVPHLFLSLQRITTMAALMRLSRMRLRKAWCTTATR